METVQTFLNKHLSYRFFVYSGAGLFTFLFDLLLLYIFTDVLGIYYVFSAAIAFVIALSIHYTLSRKYAFRDTTRSAHMGYALFFLIGGVGLLLVTGLMYVFVDMLHVHYFWSRIIIAGIVSLWGYFMNFYINFKAH